MYICILTHICKYVPFKYNHLFSFKRSQWWGFCTCGSCFSTEILAKRNSFNKLCINFTFNVKFAHLHTFVSWYWIKTECETWNYSIECASSIILLVLSAFHYIIQRMTLEIYNIPCEENISFLVLVLPFRYVTSPVIWLTVDAYFI